MDGKHIKKINIYTVQFGSQWEMKMEYSILFYNWTKVLWASMTTVLCRITFIHHNRQTMSTTFRRPSGGRKGLATQPERTYFLPQLNKNRTALHRYALITRFRNTMSLTFLHLYLKHNVVQIMTVELRFRVARY